MRFTIEQIEEENKRSILVNEWVKSGRNYAEIAEMMDLTPERVRQIAEDKKTQYCSYHDNRYAKKCNFCTRENKYLKKLENLDEIMKKEISRLSTKDRSKELVEKRLVLINKLRTEKNLAIAEIAKLFGFDHSTIIHYFKKYDERKSRQSV